jgi:hypothetical protein
MLIYSDHISGDEMFSDAFPIKLVDDIVYEVNCQMITVKEGAIDIGMKIRYKATWGSLGGFLLLKCLVIILRCQPVRRGGRRGYRRWHYHRQQRCALLPP